jgi:hypothetical protein
MRAYLMAWVRAARRQSRTHSLAEDWMTPPPRLPGDRLRNFSGRPDHHQTYVLDRGEPSHLCNFSYGGEVCLVWWKLGAAPPPADYIYPHDHT